MQALRIHPGYFGIADYESVLILNWSTLMYASPAGLSIPADWFRVRKCNIQIQNQHIEVGHSMLPSRIF